MITLNDTKYGVKRKAIIGGVSFDILQKQMQVSFYVQLIDSEGKLLNDKSLVQNRSVGYNMTNQSFVNAAFDPVVEGAPGALAEFDYFMQLMSNTDLPSLTLQLATKLKQRGIFE